MIEKKLLDNQKWHKVSSEEAAQILQVNLETGLTSLPAVVIDSSGVIRFPLVGGTDVLATNVKPGFSVRFVASYVTNDTDWSPPAASRSVVPPARI